MIIIFFTRIVDQFKEHDSVECSKGSGPQKIQISERINLVQYQIENNPQTSWSLN